ncbi:MAG: hypothetical protein ACLGHQ_04490 [Acidimicrobiia bacterium]
MKRHATRILPAALAAVLVLGACGNAEDDAAPEPPADQPDDSSSDGDLRAPTPIEFTSGGTAATTDSRIASTEGALAADDMMIMPYFDIEYVLGDGLVAPTDDTGYVYDASAELTAEQVTALATALGIEGEPVRIDEGYGVSWRVGPDDGTAPSLWVSDDAQQWWNYSSAWADQGMVREACAVSIDSEGNETVEDCPEPEPPVGVPTADEAEQRARELLTALGVDPATVEFDTYADEWFASVTANVALDARTPLVSWNFGFGAEGVLQYAGGSLATPAPVGPYPLIDIATAFERLQDQSWAGFMARGLDTPAVDVAVAEPAPDMPESGEPTIEPLPADDVPIDVAIDPPIDGSIPEMETVTVTLVDVQADLWWAWDVDGTVWLLPAYRFIGDDGGWYTVPAVTDEFLIQVDPPAVEEPMPVEPGEGTGSSEPGEPGDSVEPVESVPVESVPVESLPVEPTEDPAAIEAEVRAALEAELPMALDAFTERAKALGFETRVTVENGEDLAVTADYRLDRVNVEVVDGQVVAIQSVG